ncbi:MAG TPA: tetratricopeptide repeat protein [Cyclobacteriaceae bacterium]|nr:tetratricopeptide repeat protein [Cyclobacteriaceae bacterium]
MSRKVSFILLFTTSLFCQGTFGQGQSIATDSLEQRLAKSKGEPKVDILNQLTYEFITHDSIKVENYNKQALELSKSIGYLKGQARAYTYRGVYKYLSGRLSEGHRDLTRGLQLAKQSGDEHLRGYTLLQLGVCSLEEVETDSAILFFKKSREIFKDSTDPGTLSKVYRNLSALYGQRHQTDSQQFYLDRAIRIRKLLPNKTLLAEAIILKANTTVRLGNFTESEKLLKEASEIISPGIDDDENRADIMHVRALILFQKGKFDEAIALSDSARNYFFKKTLVRKYVTLMIDLGTVFANKGEYELALNNLYGALRLSKLRGFNAEIGIIRIEIGWINLHLRDPHQAIRMADEALDIGPKKLLKSDRAHALSLKGVALTDLKDYEESHRFLDSALAIYTSLRSLQGISETHQSLGYLEGQRKKYTDALNHYHEAIHLAESIRNSFGLAWSYWGIGDIYFKMGDFKNAMQFLDLSLAYARRVGSNEVVLLNYNTRRDLLTSQGSYQEALKFSALANQLNDSLHLSDVARRFVNLEKIQEIEQRDRDIKVLQQDKLLAEDKLKLQDAQLKQQSTLIIAGIIGLLLISALAIAYYLFYKRIKSLKEEIQMQADQLAKLVAEKTIELKRTNEELVKYNSELLQFSYTVSHNLRGPVARLLGLTVLVNKENDAKQIKQLNEFIGKTAHDLDVIIKDLGKLLELRNNPHQFHELVELASEWEQSKSLLQDSLTGNEDIIANFEGLPIITSVRPMLQSIFYNLLSNAIKFQSPDRRLKVTATSRRINGKAILEVSDNGLGFNKRLHHEKLFKLYKRFHTHVEGRGLGLYLIKSQIEVLHGSIEVDSEPDKGSTFKVILPLRTVELQGEFK